MMLNYRSAIYDQQNEGSCVENVMCSDMQRVLLQAGVHDFNPPSRQYLYNQTLIAQGTAGIDFGSIPNTTFNVAKEMGVAPESDLSYGLENIGVVPSAQANADALNFRITGHTSINIYQDSGSLAQTIITALSRGYAVELATKIHAGFFNEKPSNLNYDNSGPVVGGHDLLIVGWEPSTDPTNTMHVTFDVQNSWGTVWGAKGIGHIMATQLPLQPNGLYDTMQMDILDGVVINGRTIDIKWTDQRALAGQDFLVFGRAAGPGIYYFADRITNGESQIHILNDMIYNSVEGQGLFAHESNAQFVTTMFQNLFGRDPKAGGLAYWTDIANSGITRGELADKIIHGVAAGSDDSLALTNRAEVSTTTALAYQNQNVDHNASVVALIGVNYDHSTEQPALTAFHQQVYGY